ncbi:MAG: ABC transporter permease subunit [Caldilineaceae bacterium SB0664_bin_22]|nr:ABC transporter permease subunit [Caldilineaceae bacterium SB0664_bin_22]MYC62843.1 ABC transporter permease subunit [Caldilineaceae bacterium SB0661_bin_34]
MIMIEALRGLTYYKGVPLWRHALVLQWALQIISGVIVVVLVATFFTNITNTIEDREIPHGFSFLSREYQTPIGQHFLPYESSDSFLYAFGVAATNTIIVSIVGVILATALGIVVGVARISGNWLVSKTSLIYIEVFRNVPLLVQLFFWFYVVLALPPVRQGYVIADKIYINNAGLSLPWPSPSSWDAAWVWLAVALASIIAAMVLYRALTQREALTGRSSYPLVSGSVTAIAIAVAGWLFVSTAFGDAPFGISDPAPQGTFGRIAGGFTISGGLMALLAGLVIYTSSFIAEIVRAGIQSVGRGQTEAARSLGLAPMAALRHVTFPQALRVIIPPLISQFLNLTKNSSLAGAIGYSDLANVAKTMTQTAPAVSIYVLLAAAYLAMSLTYSLIGNIYNRSIRLVGN